MWRDLSLSWNRLYNKGIRHFDGAFFGFGLHSILDEFDYLELTLKEGISGLTTFGKFDNWHEDA